MRTPKSFPSEGVQAGRRDGAPTLPLGAQGGHVRSMRSPWTALVRMPQMPAARHRTQGPRRSTQAPCP
eukprot:9672211-Alexandrium_andersonii.AAC.1